MSAAGAATQPKRAAFVIPSLDGIRAISFMMVFLAHAGAPGIPGGFGVTVFFFLSGYLITTLLRREGEQSGTISLKLFYLRRALRILPPFYFVLAFAFALNRVGLLAGELSWPGLAAQVLHYSNYWILKHGWDGLLGGTGVYWSLAVEEHFYLVFPALYLVLLKASATRRAQRSVLWGLCGLVLAWRLQIVFGQGVIGDRTYIASDARFDSMLFGCALAVCGNPAMDFEKASKPRPLELAWLLAGACLLLVSFVVRDPAFRETLRYTLQGIGLYPLFFVAIRYPAWGPARFLNLRPVRFVGTLSYSLYLLHQVVLYVVEQNLQLPRVAGAVLSFAIALGLATGVWRFIEKPTGKLRAHLTVNRVRPVAIPD